MLAACVLRLAVSGRPVRRRAGQLDARRRRRRVSDDQQPRAVAVAGAAAAQQRQPDGVATAQHTAQEDQRRVRVRPARLRRRSLKRVK